MREAIKDSGRIAHMLEMSRLLESEKVKHNLEEIKNDKILFYGLSKMVEIIGEAAYMTSKQFKDSHQQLPWRQIEGMRHILVHGYFTVSAEVLWDVIQNDIPDLIPIFESYLNEFIE